MNQANQTAGFGTLFTTRAAPSSALRAATAALPRLRRRGELWRHLAAALAGARRRRQLARDLRALQHLDDRLLRDIGLTRADVETELSKPLWRAASQQPGRGGFGNN